MMVRAALLLLSDVRCKALNKFEDPPFLHPQTILGRAGGGKLGSGA